MWTQFHDMHSGGDCKEDWRMIYIEAPEKEAAVIFYNRFGHSPFRVTCTCCGEDYSLTESESLEQATAYERNCRYASPKKGNGKGRYFEADEAIPEDWKLSEFFAFGNSEYMTLEEYVRSGMALIIPEYDIDDDERIGEIPEQGYVWVD